jgi:hypothetical protein
MFAEMSSKTPRNNRPGGRKFLYFRQDDDCPRSVAVRRLHAWRSIGVRLAVLAAPEVTATWTFIPT